MSDEIHVHPRENPAFEHHFEGRTRSLGSFSVKRLLPNTELRNVSAFVFFDHMGPADLPPGTGMDVRPHPHIGLATVTYLFEGEIGHRDSLGIHQVIAPGAMNWMTAGKGIVHSERTEPEKRASGMRIHGIQLWVALPLEHENIEPSFVHHPKESLPEVSLPHAKVRVLVGEAFGVQSPVSTLSRMFYVDVALEGGANIAVPDTYSERAFYVAEGSVQCDGCEIPEGHLITLKPGVTLSLACSSSARVVIFGGDPLDAPRYLDWNFVASSKEKLEAAKSAWRARQFPLVPGDSEEFIPLP